MKKHVGKIFYHEKLQTSGASLFALSAAPLGIALMSISPVLAQSSVVNTTSSFPFPESVPSGTQVRINGSTSMEKTNQALTEQFKTKFPGTNVNVAYEGTDASLKALPKGTIDLAAIGRPLTRSEKAQGLTSTPLKREKIAIIVGKDNPHINNLTSEQFAKIFRGEITNWSQVGGPSQVIRLIDRPANSDTRQALQNYPVFQKAPFKTGTNATTVSQDSTETVIKKLGKDGIGYAIFDQVTNNPDVHIVPLHDVLPSDPRYPFSQPLGYAYERANPTAATKAFLGFATAPVSQRVVQEAKGTNTLSTPETKSTPTVAETSPATAATSEAVTEPRSESPSPWWWLLLPLLGLAGLLWWLLNRRSPAPAATGVPTPIPASTRTPESRIILTPRNCRDAYAYWEVPYEVKQDLQRQGRRNLKLRLYDVTDLDMNYQAPRSMKEFDVDDRAQDIHLPIAVDNRDYVVELGYVDNNNRWFSIARSAHVRVPACEPVGSIPIAVAGATAAGVGTGFLASNPSVRTTDDSRVILVPRNSKDAYAYWEIPEARKAEMRRQGGRKLALRVYDTTGVNDLKRLPGHSFREFECDESTNDLHIPITQSDRNYIAELGYLTDDGRWLKLAQSEPVEIPSTLRDETIPRTSIAEGTTTVPGLGTAAQSFLERRPGDILGQGSTLSTTSHQPGTKSDCQIILVPRNARDAYAYWEVADEYKAAVRRQGGRRFVLRVHDVTNIDIDHQPPHSTQEYPCDEHEQDKHVAIPVSDRDYLAEVGYYTDDNRWLSIIRSFYVQVPSDKVLKI